MKAKNIESFRFKQAEYIVSDEEGREVVLKVNYAENKFRIKGERNNAEFLQELESIAQDLLSRKHGVNFVERF